MARSAWLAPECFPFRCGWRAQLLQLQYLQSAVVTPADTGPQSPLVSSRVPASRRAYQKASRAPPRAYSGLRETRMTGGFDNVCEFTLNKTFTVFISALGVMKDGSSVPYYNN